MADQNDVIEIFKLENLGNVGNVSVEPHVRASEMQALATAGSGGGVDLMAHRPQSVGDVLPHPTTVPGTMYQYESSGLSSRRCALAPGCGFLR